MNNRLKLTVLAACAAATLYSCGRATPTTDTKGRQPSRPRISGAMKNVMHKGELFPTINLDTIANKTHLYGLGPVAYLTGEIMILDGKAYKSAVINDTAMQVIETFDLKAPFFGYANVDNWSEYPFPDSIHTIPQLENYLNETTKQYPRPFFFRITTTVDSATVHIVNLPPGSKISSPEEAHHGLRHYSITDRNVELIGFFSTEHKTIFTQHDTWVHIHLMTDDRKKMGHLEELYIKKGSAKLFLPQL